MAGKKGRSGGARPGAGRPPGSKTAASKLPLPAAPKAPPKRAAKAATTTPPAPAPVAATPLPPPAPSQFDQAADPKDFLLSVMNNEAAPALMRLDAAKSLLPFFHPRKSDAGKKAAALEKAGKAGTGKFARKAAPPKLVVSNG